MKEQETETTQGLISDSDKEVRPIVSKKWLTSLINYIIISAFTNFIFFCTQENPKLLHISEAGLFQK